MGSNTSNKMILVMFVLFGRIQWNRLRATNLNDLSITKEAECDLKARPQLFLTISSLADTTKQGLMTQRLIELNWYDVKRLPGDTVGVFRHDPTLSTKDAVDETSVDRLADTFYRSRIQFPVIYFNEERLTSECLGYWGAYYRENGNLVVSNCVRARPFWMSEIRSYIGKSNLTNLMIPGTHDAGSYSPYEGRKSENIVTRYMFAQEDDIFTQLCFGIRHLDLRTAFYERTQEKFWINHSIFRTNNPLSKVISDVKRFIRATKEEIIILDFHRFPVGFKNMSGPHIELIEMLEKELGEYLIPTSMGYSATVDQILDSGKRVLVAYNSKARLGQERLWPDVKQKWGNQQELPGLKSYLERVFGARLPGMLWAAMAELTPTSSWIVLKPREGLRFLADKANRNVTDWFYRSQWSWKANIVASDYYLGNSVIEMAVNTNIMKMVCSDEKNEIL